MVERHNFRKLMALMKETLSKIADFYIDLI